MEGGLGGVFMSSSSADGVEYNSMLNLVSHIFLSKKEKDTRIRRSSSAVKLLAKSPHYYLVFDVGQDAI